MDIKISRSELLTALQSVIGVVERRQSLPILGNVLLSVQDDELSVCSSDLEVQIERRVEAQNLEPGRLTAPARKLYDICRGLPEGAMIELRTREGRLHLNSGRSRFVLSTLPAEDFPSMTTESSKASFRLPSGVLRSLIHKTQFAMAQQDVRYYLNGLLLDFRPGHIRAVATDGHRLALSDQAVDHAMSDPQQAILPRKTVLELMRLVDDSPQEVDLQFSPGQVQIAFERLRITSKLIDGRFPDYERVIPADANRSLSADRQRVRAALSRAAILSNEKFRGVRLRLENDIIYIQTQNPEQEEAEEELEVEFKGEPLEIGFNVNYLLDALDAVSGERFQVDLRGADSSGLLYDPEQPQHKFVVMPMRL